MPFSLSLSPSSTTTIKNSKHRGEYSSTANSGGIPKVISEQNMPYTRSTRSGKSRAEAPQPGIDADESAEITENIKELLLPSDEDVSDRARKLLTELRKFPENFDFNKLGDALMKKIHKKLQLSTKPKTPTLVKNLKFIVVSGVVYLMLSFSSLVSSSDKIVVSPFSQRKHYLHSMEKVLRL